MAQPIKYNAGSLTANCCIKKGNYDIGIVSQYEYGPTSSTGFYAGYTIPSGGFVSYQNKASQGPSIYNIPSVNDLVAFGEQLNIGTQSTPEDVLFACANLNTIALVNIDYPELPSIGNVRLTLDAGYTASYPWTNTSWFDITGNGNTGTLQGCSFLLGNSPVNYSNSSINQSANNTGDMVFVPAFAGTLATFTVNVWINSGGNGYGNRINVVGQQSFIGLSPQADCNFLIRGNGTNGYEGLIRISGADYTVDFGSIVGGWRMLTLTFDGSNLVAYENGNQVGLTLTGPIAGLTTNGLQTIIGGTTNGATSQGTPAYFNGAINVVNIYGTALSSGEITSLYNVYQGPRGF